jgi:hypothetical protein
MKNKDSDMIETLRARHHAALAQMMPAGNLKSGRAIWRQLRRLEATAHSAALRACNVGLSEDEQDKVAFAVTRGVEKVFGRPVPGFFINWDPRGYALKLQPKSVPYPLHSDWGGYQILAPEIDQA